MRPPHCLLALAPAAALAGESLLAPAEDSRPMTEVEPLPEFAPTAAPSGPVTNAFHFYDIQEIYSNADGSVQFVELFTAVDGQQFLSGHTLKLEQISPLSTLATFNFTNGPSPTINRTLLIGTASLGTLYGVTPDFVIPAGFLSTSGTNKRVSFAEGTDVVNIGSLPFDGVQSLNGMIGNSSATSFSINSQATPRNWAGVEVTIPEPGVGAALLAGGLAMLRRRR